MGNWTTRPVPQAALDLIRAFEGLRLTAYRCPAGVLTIGYGHTGPDVLDGMTITKEKAEELLRCDAARAGDVICAEVNVPLTDDQFAALVSFVFNVGANNFRGSTLLRLLNRGWHEQVPPQLIRWNKAGGEVLGGLVRRRSMECKLWNRET